MAAELRCVRLPTECCCSGISPALCQPHSLTSCRVLVVSWRAESVSPGSVGGGEQKRISVPALEGRKCPRSLAWHKSWAKLCFSCLPHQKSLSVLQEPNPCGVFTDLYCTSEAEVHFFLHLFRGRYYLESRKNAELHFFPAPIPCKKAESSGKHLLPSLTVAVKGTQVCYESC